MAVSSLLRFCSPSSQDCRSGHSRHVWTLLVTLTAVIFLANVARADCYWPDGTENDEHQPCYVPHGGAIGLCCGTGDVCLSNGVCMSDMEVDASEGYIYYRGSCTFKDWSKGKNCPTMCIKGSGISPHTDVGVIPCPGSDTGWYCADSNVHKANCSTGAFIVSLSKPVSFTTIGISPSKSVHATASTSTTASSRSTTTTVLVTASGNATASAAAPTSISSGKSGSPVATSTAASGSPSSTAVPPPPPKSNSSANVPLAVGVTIGGASIIAAAMLGYYIWSRRKRDEPAPAESPPPHDVPDDDILNSVLAGSLFRSGSLLSRRPSKTYLNNMGAGDAPLPSMPDTGSALGGQRGDSLRSGSMLSSFQQYQQYQQNQQQQQQQYQKHQNQQHQQPHLHLHQPHPQRHYGYPQARFSPDAVAMHGLRRTPPVAWGHQGGGPSVTSEPIPEIPYDGRRMAPYHGVPMMEHNAYSELPG